MVPSYRSNANKIKDRELIMGNAYVSEANDQLVAVGIAHDTSDEPTSLTSASYLFSSYLSQKDVQRT